jgi:hypothetical protein
MSCSRDYVFCLKAARSSSRRQIARFSASLAVGQAAISARVRRHPRHRWVSSSMRHRLTQGDLTPCWNC